MISRRAFSTALLAGAAASLLSTRGMAATATPVKARNVVLVHGLFADGSCWSEVIARLQAAGLNATAVQNPLTTLDEAVASTERVLARQDGPTVLVGHSFCGNDRHRGRCRIPTVPPSSTWPRARRTRAKTTPRWRRRFRRRPRAPGSSSTATKDVSPRKRSCATCGRSAGGKSKGALRRSAAVQQGAAVRQNHAGGLAHEAQLLCGINGRSHHQSGPRALHGQADGAAKTIEVKASHLSLISRPDEITQLILEAAGQRP